MDITVVNRYGVLGFRIGYAIHKDDPHLARMRETLKNRVEVRGLTSLSRTSNYNLPKSFSNWKETLRGLGEEEDIILLFPLYPLYGEIRTAEIFKTFLYKDDSVKFFSDNKGAPPICSACKNVLECLQDGTTPLSTRCTYFKTAPTNGIAIGNMLEALNKEVYEEFISSGEMPKYDTIAPLLGMEASDLELLLEVDEEAEVLEEQEELETETVEA